MFAVLLDIGKILTFVKCLPLWKFLTKMLIMNLLRKRMKSKGI
jgi:hypothetical protein